MMRLIRDGMLEQCILYLDAAIYNLKQKQTNFDSSAIPKQLLRYEQGLTSTCNSGAQSVNLSLLQKEESGKAQGSFTRNFERLPLEKTLKEQQMKEFPKDKESLDKVAKKLNISSKMMKLRYMTKFHLQLCAILSQMNKHQQAAHHGKIAVSFCEQLIQNTLVLCTGYIDLQKKKAEINNASSSSMKSIKSQGQLSKNAKQTVLTSIKGTKNMNIDMQYKGISPSSVEQSGFFLSKMYSFNLKSEKQLLDDGDEQQQQKERNRKQQQKAGTKISVDRKQALSYYIEENTPLLEDLITNCHPILDELNSLIKYFRESFGEKHPCNSEVFRNQDEDFDHKEEKNQGNEEEVGDVSKRKVVKRKSTMLKNAWLSIEKDGDGDDDVHPFYKKKKFKEEYNIQSDVNELNDIVLAELIKSKNGKNSQKMNKLRNKLGKDYQNQSKSRNQDSSLYLRTSNSRPQTLQPKLSSPISQIQPSSSLSSHMKNLKNKVRNLTSACAVSQNNKKVPPKNISTKESKSQYKQSYGSQNLSEDDIKRMKRRDSLRLYVRNILGIKRSDDWIYSINIGNVMHLIPLLFNQFNYHLDNSHELSRDAMLEKVILLSIGYFCIGTQIRFLSSKNSGASKKYDRKDSERWHAKSLQISCMFLPTSCPLISHIITSYQKHHSPVCQSIVRQYNMHMLRQLLQPQNQEFTQNLKVIRPLNNDIPAGNPKLEAINFHQIVRTPNVQKSILNQRKNQLVGQNSKSLPPKKVEQKKSPRASLHSSPKTNDPSRTKVKSSSVILSTQKNQQNKKKSISQIEVENQQHSLSNLNIISNTKKEIFLGKSKSQQLRSVLSIYSPKSKMHSKPSLGSQFRIFDNKANQKSNKPNLTEDIDFSAEQCNSQIVTPLKKNYSLPSFKKQSNKQNQTAVQFNTSLKTGDKRANMSDLTLPDSLTSFSGTQQTKNSTKLRNLKQAEIYRKQNPPTKGQRSKNKPQLTSIWNSPPPVLSPVSSSHGNKPGNWGKTIKPSKSIATSNFYINHQKINHPTDKKKKEQGSNHYKKSSLPAPINSKLITPSNSKPKESNRLRGNSLSSTNKKSGQIIDPKKSLALKSISPRTKALTQSSERTHYKKPNIMDNQKRKDIRQAFTSRIETDPTDQKLRQHHRISIDSNTNDTDGIELLQVNKFNISSNPKVRTSSLQNSKKKQTQSSNIIKKSLRQNRQIFLHKIKQTATDEKREILSQDEKDKPSTPSKYQTKPHLKQFKKHKTMQQSLSLQSLYQPLPSPLPHHSTQNRVDHKSPSSEIRDNNNNNNEDEQEEKKIPNSILQSSINNHQPKFSGRGGGKFGSRVPKQPHQHFIDSSKVKRTLGARKQHLLQQQQMNNNQDEQNQKQTNYF